MRPDPKQIAHDRRTLQIIIDDARNGASTLIASDLEALERIALFLQRPTAREVDAIVDFNGISQHDAERTVDALFGKSNQ